MLNEEYGSIKEESRTVYCNICNSTGNIEYKQIIEECNDTILINVISNEYVQGKFINYVAEFENIKN